jgi:hypothetical protein
MHNPATRQHILINPSPDALLIITTIAHSSFVIPNAEIRYFPSTPRYPHPIPSHPIPSLPSHPLHSCRKRGTSPLLAISEIAIVSLGHPRVGVACCTPSAEIKNVCRGGRPPTPNAPFGLYVNGNAPGASRRLVAVLSPCQSPPDRDHLAPVRNVPGWRREAREDCARTVLCVRGTVPSVLCECIGGDTSGVRCCTRRDAGAQRDISIYCIPLSGNRLLVVRGDGSVCLACSGRGLWLGQEGARLGLWMRVRLSCVAVAVDLYVSGLVLGADGMREREIGSVRVFEL